MFYCSTESHKLCVLHKKATNPSRQQRFCLFKSKDYTSRRSIDKVFIVNCFKWTPKRPCMENITFVYKKNRLYGDIQKKWVGDVKMPSAFCSYWLYTGERKAFRFQKKNPACQVFKLTYRTDVSRTWQWQGEKMVLFFIFMLRFKKKLVTDREINFCSRSVW